MARRTVDDAVRAANGRVDAVLATNVDFSEPGARYIDFLIPGIIGMNLMGGGLWGVGFVLVDMRIRKLLKRFIATPMKKSDFMIAVMVSRMLFLIPEIIIVLLFARWAFGVVCPRKPRCPGRGDHAGGGGVFRHRTSGGEPSAEA